MAIRIASYIKRNRLGIYCFRRLVPPELEAILGTGEITRSTHTRDCRLAAEIVRSLSASVDLILRRARQLKEKKGSTVRMDWTLKLDIDPQGNRRVEVEVEPGEEASVKETLPAVLEAIKTPRAAQSVSGSPRLFDEIDKYLDEEERSGHWRPQTAIDIRGDFGQFKAILGDIPISALNHETLNKLRDTLVRLPANINKLRETRGKSIDEILALNLPPQSSVTSKKKWDRVTAFCERLLGRGLITHNYARGKKPRARSTLVPSSAPRLTIQPSSVAAYSDIIKVGSAYAYERI